jgi:oligopeptide/dipeptide ABC transporter ATP-binding protein
MVTSSVESAPVNGTEFMLEVEDLSFELDTPAGRVKLVNNVSFTLRRGETLGIVGESGSGKTMLMRAIMGIAPRNGITSGRIVLDGVDLLELPLAERRRRLGVGIGMIFQNPMTSLNPVVPVGRQITEGLRYHRKMSKGRARARAIELLERVGIAEPEQRLRQYTFELSGGTCQRIMIATALATDPDVLVADEATTALDVTVQKQILDLIAEIQAARTMTVLLISHDLGVVGGRSDKVAVMYAGQVVEAGPTARLFARSRHQYTHALLGAIPDLKSPIHSRMLTIPGAPPRPSPDLAGCPFAGRCIAVTDICRTEAPPLTADEGMPSHWYRCHHPREVDAASATADGAAPVIKAVQP